MVERGEDPRNLFGIGDDLARRLAETVATGHGRFELLPAKQSERILRAMDNCHSTLPAHPTERVIESRAPYDADMLRIIRHARQRGGHLELNAHPELLDLQGSRCLMAKGKDVLVAVNSGAHSREDYAHRDFGIGQARRGWLEATGVLNTRPLSERRQFLAQARK